MHLKMCTEHMSAQALRENSYWNRSNHTEYVETIALVTLTGNIGHDIYNSWLNLFAQQHLQGRPFNKVIVDVSWFGGWKSWWSASYNDGLWDDGD